MADSEPLFDPSLKKKKSSKKTVDFSGLDDDAAPGAAPVPAPADADNQEAPISTKDGLEEDDMFGGLKKKKKSKKAIPLDLDEAEASAEPASEAGAAAAAATEDGDLDFGEMKKKKKKSKKAAFDMEAFEKELDDGGNDGGADGTDAVGGAADGEGDLGDDPFANDEEGDVEDTKADAETWHGTDRDYTYQEVSHSAARDKSRHCSTASVLIRTSLSLPSFLHSFLADSSMSFVHKTRRFLATRRSTPWFHRKSHETAPRRRPSPTSSTSARGCTVNQTTSFNTCSPS